MILTFQEIAGVTANHAKSAFNCLNEWAEQYIWSAEVQDNTRAAQPTSKAKAQSLIILFLLPFFHI